MQVLKFVCLKFRIFENLNFHPCNSHADVSCDARGLSLHLYSIILCIRTGEALASLPIYTDTPEPSLLESVISTKISWADPNFDLFCLLLNVFALPLFKFS